MNHWLVFAIPASFVAVFALLWICRKAYKEAMRERPLSPKTSIVFEEVNESLTPPAAAVAQASNFKMPLKDILSIYVSSKKAVSSSHRMFLLSSGDPYITAYRDRLEGDHKRLWKLLVGSIMESAVNTTLRARMQQYSRASLWIYAEETAILTEMSDCFQELVGSSLT